MLKQILGLEELIKKGVPPEGIKKAGKIYKHWKEDGKSIILVTIKKINAQVAQNT